MDWTSVILALLSGTTVGGIFEAVRYRRQNKRLKENEVKASDIDTQRQQMELGEDYLKKVMELSELNYQATLKNGTDNSEIIGEVKKIVRKVDDIEGYLNGGFKDYMKNKETMKLVDEDQPDYE